jgi:hypothetical protein
VRILKYALGGSAGRLVDNHGVHCVIEVFHKHFPVGIMHVAETAAGDFYAAFRGSLYQVIYGGGRSAQPGLQVGTFRAETGEHQPVIAVNAR